MKNEVRGMSKSMYVWVKYQGECEGSRYFLALKSKNVRMAMIFITASSCISNGGHIGHNTNS